jgi:DNA polymerase I
MGTPLPSPGADKTLYIVDLSSYLLRAYHAIAPLTSPSGEPTHAVHGLVNMLERLCRLQEPRLLAVCMDSGRATFRHQIFPSYKANRPPQPSDLKVQMARAEEIVRKSGFLVLKQDGVEADDLIASLVEWSKSFDLQTVIVGADKDLMQLASEKVILWDTMQNRVFGSSEVTEKFGVGPAQLGDLLALTGDSSDNVPGVPSVGPKTATKLLSEYGDLENVLRHASEVPQKKLKEALVEHTEAARLSRKLVELKRDCPIQLSPADLTLGHGPERDDRGLVELFEELGFTRQLTSLKAGGSLFGTPRSQDSSHLPPRKDPAGPVLSEPEPSPASAESQADLPQARAPVRVVSDPDDLEKWLTTRAGRFVSLEVFTLHPEHHRGPLIAVHLSDETEGLYLPLRHRNLDRATGFPLESLMPILLRASKVRFCSFNGKKQRVLLEQEYGPIARKLPPIDDVLLAAYLVDPERRHSLESLAVELAQTLRPFDALSRDGKQRRDHDELSESAMSGWAMERGQVVLRATGVLLEKLNELSLTSLYQELELPLSEQLAEMEILGVLVDTGRLSEMGALCDLELTRLEAEAIRIAGKEFNVNSPRQLETILFDDLGLKPQKRTKTARSTDAQTLEVLSDEHPLPDVILEYRQIAKLKSTYIDALPSLVDPKTGRVHSAWEQAVAATGRLSSVDPNLQNIPIRSELGRKIRGAFVAPPGYLLVSADYSQIELRILAHLSQDERLVEAFRTGQDVHLRTAMEIFEVPADQVTREMRARAKAVNFGVIYGQGESGLAKALRIERKVAFDFITKYFARYHGVRTFLDQTLAKAREGEVVTTILGRRRILPDITSANRARRLAAERIATNLPIQGSAADILKLAMLKCRAPITKGARLVLTVHDELVFEVPQDEVAEAAQEVVKRMSQAYPLSVPLEVTAGSGPDWNQAH